MLLLCLSIGSNYSHGWLSNSDKIRISALLLQLPAGQWLSHCMPSSCGPLLPPPNDLIACSKSLQSPHDSLKQCQ